MRTFPFIKTFGLGMMLASAPVFATGDLTGATPATCSCQNSADCTCAKGQCKCPKCGKGAKAKMFESLKGVTETRELPKTARSEDARGGIFI